MQVEVKRDLFGRDVIVFSYTDEDGTAVEHGVSFPAIASRREYLGIDDPVKVVEAILHTEMHGEPPHDPETGRNAWTEPYLLLCHREQARAHAAAIAESLRADRATIIERANQAAYDAVHIPVQGDKCAMDLAREQAQRDLKLPKVAAKCGPDSRTKPCTIRKPARAEWETIGPLTAERARAEQVADILAGREQELLGYTQAFLHRLSGDAWDRITPPPEPDAEPEAEPPPTLPTAEDVLTKYQESPK